MPTYQETVNEVKRWLASIDEQLMSEIDILFLAYIDKLQVQFDRVVSEIETLESRGVIINDSVFYKATRLRVAVAQLIDLTERFNRNVRKAIEPEIVVAREQAIEHARKLIETRFPVVLRNSPEFHASFLRFDDRALMQLINRIATRKPIADILEANVPDAVAGVNDVFIRAIINGSPPKQAAAELYAHFGVSYNRAQTTARTEIITAYRDANIERYKESVTVKLWQWSATLDSRTCPVCIALDGKRFSLETPFATHPQCRCSPLPVTMTLRELGIDMDEPQHEEGLRGEEFLRSKPESFQRKILHRKWMYEAWSSGKINLSDIVQEYNHPVYGPSRQQSSRKRLIQLGILSR